MDESKLKALTALADRLTRYEAALRELRDKSPVKAASVNKTYLKGYADGVEECNQIARRALED